MKDPVGQLVTELRTAGVASQRVAAGEAQPGWAQEAGSYQRFVVLVNLGRTLITRVPVQSKRVGYRAYGSTPQDASSLSGDIATALHLKGGRAGSGGRWIFQSVEETGDEPEADPKTGQPYTTGVISLLALT